MIDPAYASIAELTAAFRRKTLSPVELLQAQLARVHEHNPKVNAFAFLDGDRALEAARASEARWARGTPGGPLDGITFSVKDNLPVAGYPSRRGSLTTSDAPMKETAPIAARCLEAGAVLVGTTTMPEFAMGPVTLNALTGVTRNPWDTGTQAGGSSGGGAAAVAAGFCTLSVASDAGGSIRIPASLCGVTGFKPSAGRVPIYPPSVAGGLSCNGPITLRVADAALALNLATRPDARDPAALPPDGVDYAAAAQGGVKGWKVALSMTLGYARKVHPEVVAAVRRAADALAALGAVVEERDPEIEDPTDTYLTLMRGTVRYSLRALTAAQRKLLAPGARDILEGPEVSLADYLGAQERSLALARRMQAFHAGYDLLVTPTTAWPAFPAERSYPAEFEEFPNRRAWVPFGALFNLTGQPAITVPAGLTAQGLPIGLHIVGPRGADAKVLRAAAAYEAAAPLAERPTLGRRTT